MLTVKVLLKNAEKAKQDLLKKGVLDFRYVPVKEPGFIYFPVILKVKGYKTAEKKLKKRKRKENFLQLAEKQISKADLAFIRRAHDVIGSIAIIEIPKELENKEKLIGLMLLETKKNITTVLKRGKHKGIYRTQILKYLAGKRTKETVYRENNVRLKLDVEKVYFSVRLAAERKRIYKQVKKGEAVLVMFSGCGPYVCAIAKNTGAAEVAGIEINPVAHDYAVENVKLNKLNNVVLINSDVKKAWLKTKFDRILMPLPKSAEDFLDTALQFAKDKAVIHFYAFLDEKEIKKAHKWIIEACRRKKRKCRIIRNVKCGQFAPNVYRFCVDFRVF